MVPFNSFWSWSSCAAFTYLPLRTWSWVNIDLKWRHSPPACYLLYQSAYYPVLYRKRRPSCHFRTLTAHSKKTKTNFQKLISKPFSTCLNLSNKLTLSKRCSWPLNLTCLLIYVSWVLLNILKRGIDKSSFMKLDRGKAKNFSSSSWPVELNSKDYRNSSNFPVTSNFPWETAQKTWTKMHIYKRWQLPLTIP